MATINVKTKFDIGDSVYGFVDGKLYNLVIDRIEINVGRFSSISPNEIRQNINIVYLATTTDTKHNSQYRFDNELLYTEEELKEYINNYFERKQ